MLGVPLKVRADIINIEKGFIAAVSGYQEGLIPDAIPRAHYRINAIEDNIFSFFF